MSFATMITSVLQICESLKATFEAGWQDGAAVFMRHPAHGNVGAGLDEDFSALEASQLANQTPTRALQDANDELRGRLVANQAELEEASKKNPPAGPVTALHAGFAMTNIIRQAPPGFTPAKRSPKRT